MTPYEAADRLKEKLAAADRRLWFVPIPGGTRPRYRVLIATANTTTETAEIENVTRLAAIVSECPYAPKSDTVSAAGAGFNRAQHIADSIGQQLWGIPQSLTYTVL